MPVGARRESGLRSRRQEKLVVHSVATRRVVDKVPRNENYVRRTECRMNRLWAWTETPSSTADKECHEGSGRATMRKELVICMSALNVWIFLRKAEDWSV